MKYTNLRVISLIVLLAAFQGCTGRPTPGPDHGADFGSGWRSPHPRNENDELFENLIAIAEMEAKEQHDRDERKRQEREQRELDGYRRSMEERRQAAQEAKLEQQELEAALREIDRMEEEAKRLRLVEEERKQQVRRAERERQIEQDRLFAERVANELIEEARQEAKRTDAADVAEQKRFEDEREQKAQQRAAVQRAQEALKIQECKDLNRLWQDQYYVDFKIGWGRDEFACPSPTETLVKTIRFMGQMSEKPANDGTLSPNFYNQTIAPLRRTVFEEKCDIPGLRAIAIAQASIGQMTIYRDFLNQTEIWGAATLYHEAHHLASNDRHVRCTRGILRDLVQCDDSLRDTAYGASFRLLSFVYVARNTSAAEKELARTHICHILNNYINGESPADRANYRCGPAPQN